METLWIEESKTIMAFYNKDGQIMAKKSDEKIKRCNLLLKIRSAKNNFLQLWYTELLIFHIYLALGWLVSLQKVILSLLVKRTSNVEPIKK